MAHRVAAQIVRQQQSGGGESKAPRSVIALSRAAWRRAALARVTVAATACALKRGTACSSHHRAA